MSESTAEWQRFDDGTPRMLIHAKRWVRRIRLCVCVAFAAVAGLSCQDPLPPEGAWLAGSWRWLGSCCSEGGDAQLPGSPHALVLDLHHNGEFTIRENGALRTRSRFEVIEDAYGLVLHLDERLRYYDTYRVEQTSSSTMTLTSPECYDCYGSVSFVRIP